MLARVTYGLVVAALIALLLGIFVVRENNTMLFVSIALSILCIGLVVFGAARRARYVSPEGEPAPEPEVVEAGVDLAADEEDVTSTDVLAAFEDDDEDTRWDRDLDEDEEEEPAAPARRSSTKTKAQPKKKAAAKKKTAAKSTSRTTSKKVVVVPGRDRYHKADCRFVKGKDDTEEITVTAAKRQGFEPCSVCDPG